MAFSRIGEEILIDAVPLHEIKSIDISSDQSASQYEINPDRNKNNHLSEQEGNHHGDDAHNRPTDWR